jgi:putative DNA primase/helicase
MDMTIQRAIDDLNSKYTPEYVNEESIDELKSRYPWYAFSFKSNGGITKKLMPAVLTDHLTDINISVSCNNDIYIYKNGVYRQKDKSEIYQMAKAKLIKEVTMSAQIEEVYKLWVIDTYLKSSRLNLHKDMINFANTMVQVSKEGVVGTLDHDKRYLSTIQYPVGYTNNKKIDRWEQFLSEVLEPDSILLLQEVLGYLLTLDNRAKKMFLLFGPTDCGKSVILSVLTAIVGKEYVASKTLQQLCDPDKPFASFALWGKVLNICGDLPATPLKDTGIVKQLTGEDLMDFEQKGKDSFSEYCLARLLFSANQMPPSYNDRTNAFYNRLLLIAFPHSIPKSKQDEYLTSYLIDNELEGIVNWAIEGYIRLIQNKYQFTQTESGAKVIEDYKKSNNPAIDFFEECCIFDPTYASTSGDLYSQYCKFCMDNGLKPLSAHKFKPELLMFASNKGYIIEYKNRLTELRQRGFTGVKSNYSF